MESIAANMEEERAGLSRALSEVDRFKVPMHRSSITVGDSIIEYICSGTKW